MVDIKVLSGNNWLEELQKLYLPLKSEVQGPQGFIRRFKSQRDDERKQEILNAIDRVRLINDKSELDSAIQLLANEFLEINNRFSASLYYDFIALLGDNDLCDGKPTLEAIARILHTPNHNTVVADRLKALLARVMNESLSQANKSNAGEAGENLVRAILAGVGLEKDVHYREQYKSQSGSDTDFVFPCVEDEEDHKVELFLAVQMSSNDRARLTSSELKIGGKPFVFSGNGLAASKKNLKDIGAQIIESQKANRVNLVCYKPELEAEIKRLEKKPKEGKIDDGKTAGCEAEDCR